MKGNPKQRPVTDNTISHKQCASYNANQAALSFKTEPPILYENFNYQTARTLTPWNLTVISIPLSVHNKHSHRACGNNAYPEVPGAPAGCAD